MRTRSSKRPRDANRVAKLVVDLAAAQAVEEMVESDSGKNPAAVSLGRLGGQKGGKARAQKLAAEDRRRIAIIAARARWKKTDGPE